MKNTICDKNKCTACGACLNICPQKCVYYKKDGVGHLYPVIDDSKCIHCHACEKVCQVIHPLELEKPKTAYVGWHQDVEEYKSSTSGGAATAFAQKIISEGGVVYGCAWGKDLDVEHVRIDTLHDIYRLKGSKYVQSKISNNILTQVKRDLKSDLKVLFIGTPCQIAGLKSYLRKDYDNLFLADLICHGVPPVSLLKKHVKRIAGTLKNVQVSFRDEKGMSLKITRAGHVIYNKHLWLERYQDSYYNSFIDGYIYRDSCFTCLYASSNRISDVTIGDFWGLGDDFKIKHDYGCSCILPITDKGLQLVREAHLDIYERSVEEAVRGNSQLRSPFARNRRINLFRFLIVFSGFRLAYFITNFDYLWTVFRCKMKIGTRIKKMIGR